MRKVPHNSVTHLKELRSNHSRLSRAVEASSLCADWQIQSGRLINTRSNYFSVALYRKEHECRFMMEQPEGALIMLLVSSFGEEPAALIQLRSEPGLIGMTNLTATIQSTPNNFRREHGGGATPFMEVANDPGTYGRIVYDALQFDWGEFYFKKTKRFLVIDLKAPLPEAPPGFLWVSRQTLARCMLEDHLVSTDLRSCAVHWLAGQGADGMTLAGPTRDDSKPSPMDASGIVKETDSRGVSLDFYEMQTATREVSRWVQPLLRVQSPIDACLSFSDITGERLYAVKRGTQFGLLGTQIWVPAEIGSGKVVRKSLNSAEGGRFWQSLVRLRLMDVSQAALESLEEGTQWKSEADLFMLCSSPLQTSLELRLLMSLVAVGRP